MMNAQALQGRIGKGMGVAARKSGYPVGVYRPRGSLAPICPGNKIIEISALFLPGGIGGAVSYGTALWRGICDVAYTRAGDYLFGEDGTYFIASQRPGLPVQCVLTNRVVSIVRPVPAMQGGYSGFFASPGEAVIVEWPASLLESGSHAAAGEPGQARFGSWTLLLPPMQAVPQIADVVNDDLGAVYAVSSAEQGALGWRLLLRQVGV